MKIKEVKENNIKGMLTDLGVETVVSLWNTSKYPKTKNDISGETLQFTNTYIFGVFISVSFWAMIPIMAAHHFKVMKLW